jgi:hypothetical protein
MEPGATLIYLNYPEAHLSRDSVASTMAAASKNFRFSFKKPLTWLTTIG